METPNDDLTRNLTGKDFREMRARQHEDEIVRSLLAKLKLQKIGRELAKHQATIDGNFRATLDGFCSRFAEFPLYLQTSVIQGVGAKESVSRLFLRFGDTSIVKAYDEIASRSTLERRPVGMIFPWPHMPLGMILHNCGNCNHDGVKLVWQRSDDFLVLEPWASFMHSLDWRPVE